MVCVVQCDWFSFWNLFLFFFQAEDGIRDSSVTGVQTCALPIYLRHSYFDGRRSVHVRQLAYCPRMQPAKLETVQINRREAIGGMVAARAALTVGCAAPAKPTTKGTPLTIMWFITYQNEPIQQKAVQKYPAKCGR